MFLNDAARMAPAIGSVAYNQLTSAREASAVDDLMSGISKKSANSEKRRCVENCAQVIRAYLAVLAVCLVLGVSGYFFRDYLHKVLAAIEDQNDFTVFLILCLLYFAVSLPFAWGYIVVNVATGYLYGIVAGTAVTVAAAAAGVALAHQLISRCMANYLKVWLLQQHPKTSLSTGFESLVVVLKSSRSRAFKLVALTRLTPIPFGVQNAIFAAAITASSEEASSSSSNSNAVNASSPSSPTPPLPQRMSATHYLLATCVGLFPCQLLNAYLGSTFRTIEEIFHDSSSSNAVLGAAVMAAQVAVAVGVTVFVVRSANEELDKSLSPKDIHINEDSHEGDNLKTVISI